MACPGELLPAHPSQKRQREREKECSSLFAPALSLKEHFFFWRGWRILFYSSSDEESELIVTTSQARRAFLAVQLRVCALSQGGTKRAPYSSGRGAGNPKIGERGLSGTGAAAGTGRGDLEAGAAGTVGGGAAGGTVGGDAGGGTVGGDAGGTAGGAAGGDAWVKASGEAGPAGGGEGDSLRSMSDIGCCLVGVLLSFCLCSSGLFFFVPAEE